jgi:purine-nucleoside phosphorylase
MEVFMTPHNEAKLGEIAKTVIMPGDPMRAKYIAENFLENAKCVNKVRGMYCYTGTYNGKEVSVMAHGMGIPSAGIYIYELYKNYEVENIIRIGTCGGVEKSLNVLDVILTKTSYTESTFAYTFNDEDVKEATSSQELNEAIRTISKEKNIDIVEGNILSKDVFYINNHDMEVYTRQGKNSNIIACEMESFALFYLANFFGKKASCILTVVDKIDSEGIKEEIPANERERSLNKMILLALDSVALIK